jgi:hypothetical protein
MSRRTIVTAVMALAMCAATLTTPDTSARSARRSQTVPLAQPVTGGLVINEVAPGDPKSGDGWVELANNGPAIGLDGWSLANAKGGRIALEQLIPANGHMVVSFGRGRQIPEVPQGTPLVHVKKRKPFVKLAAGAVALLEGGRIHDFVAYSGSGEGLKGKTIKAAVKAGRWPAAASVRTVETDPLVLPTSPLLPGDSLGRDALSTDSNTPADWETLGGADALGPSPGTMNEQFLDDLVATAPPETNDTARAQAEKPWTIMVLVDNTDRRAEKEASAQLKSIAETFSGAGAAQRFNFVMQHPPQVAGGPAETRRDAITNRTLVTHKIPDNESVEPIDEKTVSDFIKWAKSEYPAQGYIFSFLGHGKGWKGLMFDSLRSGTRLTMATLGRGLKALGQKFDVVHFGPCLMGMVEVAHQIEERARYMVGSEEIAWGVHSWPEILAKVQDDPNITGASVADEIAKNYAKNIKDVEGAREIATMASVDLEAFREILMPAVKPFAENLLKLDVTNVKKLRFHSDNLQVRIKHDALRLQDDELPLGDPNSRDLGRFAELVSRLPVSGHTSAAAAAVMRALKPGAQDKGSQPKAPEAKAPIRYLFAGPKVKQHRHGLSIYLPHERDADGAERNKGYGDPYDQPLRSSSLRSRDLLYARDPSILVPGFNDTHELPDDHADFRFPTDTFWDEFVIRYLKPVAAACIEVPRDCVKEVETEGKVVLIGGGSSDSDGYESDDKPAHTEKGQSIAGHNAHYYWDVDDKSESGRGLPAYALTKQSPQPVPPPEFDPCNGTAQRNEADDCDRDNRHEPDDDPDLVGRQVEYTCPAPGTYIITLWVWDEHHHATETIDHPKFFGNSTLFIHNVHFQTDSSTVTVKCRKPGPQRSPTPTPSSPTPGIPKTPTPSPTPTPTPTPGGGGPKSFGVNLNGSWHHNGPGDSTLFACVSTSPAKPGASYEYFVVDPDGDESEQTGTLDASGRAQIQSPITQYGEYDQEIDVTYDGETVTQAATTNVTPAQQEGCAA